MSKRTDDTQKAEAKTAEPTTSPIVTAADEAAIMAEESHRKAKEWVSRYEAGAHQSAVHWVGIPTQFLNWHFYRAGTKRSGTAIAHAEQLRARGYHWAPAGVRIVGAFESDGSDGLYLMCPQEVFEQIQIEIKAVCYAEHERRRGVLGREVERAKRELRGRHGAADVRVVDNATGREVDPAEVYDNFAGLK